MKLETLEIFEAKLSKLFWKIKVKLEKLIFFEFDMCWNSKFSGSMKLESVFRWDIPIFNACQNTTFHLWNSRRWCLDMPFLHSTNFIHYPWFASFVSFIHMINVIQIFKIVKSNLSILFQFCTAMFFMLYIIDNMKI